LIFAISNKDFMHRIANRMWYIFFPNSGMSFTDYNWMKTERELEFSHFMWGFLQSVSDDVTIDGGSIRFLRNLWVSGDWIAAVEPERFDQLLYSGTPYHELQINCRFHTLTSIPL
jgi:hypothetical protein